MKKVLFESADDYPRIEEMICEMFRIPRNTRLLTTKVDAHIEGPTAEDTGEERQRKLEMAALKRQQMNEAAAAFLHSDLPTDLQIFSPGNLNPEEPPAVVDAGKFLRVMAMRVLTFKGDGLGIGNSDKAVKQLQSGKPSKDINAELCASIGDGSHLEVFGEHDGADLSDYVAMVSRMFLPGIIRIAFSDLGLMSYLCRTEGDVRRLMTALHEKFPKVPAISSLPGCNTARLEYFTKHVIPALAIQAVIAQGDPMGICDGDTLKQNEAFLGTDVVSALRDYSNVLEVPVDADLKTGDGRVLDYDGLLDLLDVDEMQTRDVVDRATKNAGGQYYEYVPTEKTADESTSSRDELNVTYHGHGDGEPLECPSYKVNDWYVVYVPDYEHSSEGWFHFEEPSAESQGYKFWLNGRTTKDGDYSYRRSVGDAWCIVFSGDSFWNRYGPGTEHTAYYLVHKSALDDDVLEKSTNSAEYRVTTAGCILAGYTDEREGNVRGLVSRSDGMMDRSNTVAAREGSAWYEKYISDDMKQVLSDHNFDAAYRRNLLMLSAIGVWTLKTTDWEMIKDEVTRLSDKYFPLQKGGELPRSGSPTRRLIKAGDAYDVAAVMQDAMEDENESVFERLLNGQAVFSVDGTGPYALRRLQQTSDYGLYVLSPIDGPDGDCDVYPIFVNDEGDVVPMNDTPVPEDTVMNILGSKYHARVDWDDGTDYDEWDEGNEGEISYFRPFGGKMSSSRVGIDANDAMYVCGPDTGGEPVKIAEDAPRPARARLCTYVPVEGGYNVIWRTGGAQGALSAIGYARNGRMRLFSVAALVDGTTAVISDITDPSKGDKGGDYYTLGKVDGDPMRLNANRYQSFIAIDSTGLVYESIGLKSEAIQSLSRDKGLGVIGLGIPNGRFDGGLAGVINWYDADTMAERGQSEIRVDSLDRSCQDGHVRRYHI